MVFPAEWHQQAFVQLTWPHEDTDWAPVLADAISCFCDIAREVTKREPLLIVAKEPNEAKEALSSNALPMTHGHATMLLSLALIQSNRKYSFKISNSMAGD